MKDKITQTTTDVKIAYKNFVHLGEAVSLVSVAGYTIHGTLKSAATSWVHVYFLAAALLIALVGAEQFFRHLAGKD